ncbi:MAG: TIGR01212 family radical SAM protein [Novipirellula sp. JB048]
MATACKLIDPDSNERLRWQTEDLPFNAFGASLRRRFGGRVQRVSIDAGFTCPNVDGAVARGGCNFCDNRSFSPSRRVRLKQVSEQLAEGIETVTKRYDKVAGFIAYFQPATNTYAPVEQLEEVFRLSLSISDQVVGLAVGTRPDCLPESVLALLERLARETYVSLEFGMQTIHEPGLRWMNRAHDHASMINAIDRSRGRGFECCGHVILGIPGETHAMMMETAAEIGRLGFDAIKLHNLYAVEGTTLGDQVKRGEITLFEREAYIQTVVDFLERIPPQVIVERVSGDAPPRYLVEPKWCLEKSSLRLAIEQEFKRRGTRQGAHYRPPATPPHQRPRPADETPQAIRAQIELRGRLPVLKMAAAQERAGRVSDGPPGA